ncbi:DUF1275 domain-containing protein (plasmid) [Diaphorobacter sp. HDW4A]|uniref:YoaK family protein n=1 Tax=Diaphorobacter sp. HDW4A TaxID=2714924 RepID=UPI00140B6F3E|nr:YoaK family protein [Diaphorobacter sp. HDW4A]QIL84206.1 DUF1275 domain-containing protein [Diaphorobacter sp. HDW4A]
MRRIRYLTNRHRAPSTNIALGLLLAFNAGAMNAGGFMVLHMYTSHMSGFASQFADGLTLKDRELVLSAIGAILSFLLGAAACAILVGWSRKHKLYSVYALPLMLEALLMLLFGLMGSVMLAWATPFALPLAVILLSFIMGLQNAVGSKTSGGSVRTTHMTGNITDLGMEIGKLFFLVRSDPGSTAQWAQNLKRMKTHAGLVGMFISGGISGAIGFKHAGFICVLPLAALLLLLSIPPIVRDAKALGTLIFDAQL